MPQYTREQIYEAMRRADAAGDGEAVRALAAQLQSMGGQSGEQSGFGRARRTEPQEQPARAAVASAGQAQGQAGAEIAPDRGPQAPAWMHSAVPGPVGQALGPVVQTALNTPAGQDFQRGTGTLAEGMAGYTVGFAADPVGQMLYDATGRNETYDTGEIVRNALGLPRVENPLVHEGIAAAGGALNFSGLARLVAANAGPMTQNALAPLFSTPIRDTVAGGAAGAAVEAAAEADLHPLAQAGVGFGAALVGHKVAGVPQRAAGLAGSPQYTPRQQSALDFAEANDAPLMTTDMFPPRSGPANLARNSGEAIPYAGTSGPRVRQQDRRVELVQDLARDYNIGPGNTASGLDDVAADLTARRSARLTQLTNQKNEVIDSITEPFTAAPNTVAAIDNEIASLRANFDEVDAGPIIDRLQRLRNIVTEGRSLRAIEENRRLLGDAFAGSDLATIRSFGEQSVRRIYDPLRRDMGDFIEANGSTQQRQAWQEANDELAAMAGDLRNSRFRRVLTDAEATPENVAAMLFSTKPSDVRRLMDNLGPTGQRNARRAIVYETLRRTDPLMDIENANPDRLVNAMRSMARQFGEGFEGREAAELDGLRNFLDMTRRAQQVAANPPTGNRNFGVVLGGGAVALLGPIKALIAGTSAGLMARAYESPAIRGLLARLGRTQPGSRSAQQATLQIVRQMQAEGFLNAVNDNAAVVGSAAAEEND